MVADVTVRDSEVTWQEIDDDVVVLDLTAASYLRIGGAGTTLWPLVVQGTDEAGLAARLIDAFGIDSAAADADVREFLRSLHEHRLIRWAGAPTDA